MDDSASLQSIGSDAAHDELTIPKSSKDLKACSNCGLLLNTTQWKDLHERCPNKCDSAPTKNFEGIASIMAPNRSWAAKRIGVKKQNILPGIYAVEIYDS